MLTAFRYRTGRLNFAQDERGAVLILAALGFLPLFMIIAAGFELGQRAIAMNELTIALEATAAYESTLVTPDLASATIAFNTYCIANQALLVKADHVTLTLNGTILNARYALPASFAGLIGIGTFLLAADAPV